MRSRLYPSRRLYQALGKLFDDISIPLGFLGDESELEAASPSQDVRVRASNLRAVLEEYAINMGEELDHLGEGERVRLQAEARATLVALREILLAFPEANDTTSDA